MDADDAHSADPPALLIDLVATSREVTETSRRSVKIAALAAFLRRTTGEEIEIAVAFLAGSPRQGKLGLGHATLRTAREQAAAEQSSLSLEDVNRRLAAIAAASGRGASSERARLLHELFALATASEQDFLVRLVLGELRQGALEGLMVEAIAAAASAPLADVRRACMLAGELAAVARAALSEGSHGLARFRLTLFQPVAPMLAQPAEDVPDALTRLGCAAFEWKMDGARVQVHKRGADVRVYTRSLNDVTAAVPEVVEAVGALASSALILDGETIALGPDGIPRPFQITMRRFGRKLDVGAMRNEIPLAVFFFDCLHRDGMDLIDRPAEERFAALAAVVPSTLQVPRLVTLVMDRSPREVAAQ